MQLSDHQRFCIQFAYKAEKRKLLSDDAVHEAMTKRLLYRTGQALDLADFEGKKPHKKTIRKWCQIFEDNGCVATAEDGYAQNKNAQKVTEEMEMQLKATLKETPSQRFAASFDYHSTKTGKYESLSKTTVQRVAKKHLDIAAPKNEPLVRTAHHDCMRLQFVNAELRKPVAHTVQKVQSDEKSVGLAVRTSANRDSIYVEKGQAAKSNITRFRRYDYRATVNLFLAVCQFGVLYYCIFRGDFNSKFYAEEILPDLGVEIDRLRRRNQFSVYEHDHTMRGSKPEEELDEHVGSWAATPPPPCKDRIGDKWIYVQPKTRAAHYKNIGEHKYRDVCTCRLPNGAYPALSPDLNITENFFDELDVRLRVIQKRQGKARDVDEMEERVKACISEIDEDKEWFRSRFLGLRRRYQAVVAASGGATKY